MAHTLPKALGYGSSKGGRPEYPHGDDAEPRDYAAYIRDLWEQQDEAMEGLHNVWVQNILFLGNRQWWRANPSTGIWEPIQLPSWKEQPVTNLSLSYFKTALAKATKQRPAWQVIPASSDPSDVQASELGDQLLEAKWTELRLGRIIRRAVAWTLSTGNAFLYPYWRTDTGKMIPLQAEIEVPIMDELGMPTGQFQTAMAPLDDRGEPIVDEMGRPDPTAEPAFVDQGDIGVRVFSPFQVRVNPEADCDDDVIWTIIGEVMTVDEIIDRWPEAADEVKGEDVGLLDEYDRLISTVAAGSDRQVTSTADERDRDLDKALVLHYHEKPCPEYPQGRFWIATKDTLLEGPTELPDNLWPVVIHMEDLTIPGRYYAQSTLEAVVGLNREYNEVNAAIKEHHNLMTKGKWLVPKGSGVKRGMITSEPGEVIQHTPGLPPVQADIRPLPAPVYQERERILLDFETVSSVHGVSQGKTPSGVTAGVAILQLQEADDTDLGPFLAMLEETVAQLASHILRIAKDRYVEERLIHVVGPNRKYLARSFKGADLEGCVDVVPIAESSFPWSRSARQSMLIEMAGQLPDLFIDKDTGTFDKAQFARMLPVGGLESLAQNDDLDVQEALREQEMFRDFGTISNEMPEVMWWQNHEAHFRQHVQILKSAEYKDWPPEIQMMFEQHCQMHDTFRQQQRMQAMVAQDPAAAMGLAGTPGSPMPPTAGPPSGMPSMPPGMQVPTTTPRHAQDLDPADVPE